MSNETKIEELIVQLRKVAGEIGELEAPGVYSPRAADAEDYDFKIQTGLARAALEIYDYDPSETIRWFGYCLIGLGMNVADGRMQTLLDALDREQFAQSQANEDDSESSDTE
jgi:hypothetical protein